MIKTRNTDIINNKAYSETNCHSILYYSGVVFDFSMIKIPIFKLCCCHLFEKHLEGYIVIKADDDLSQYIENG